MENLGTSRAVDSLLNYETVKYFNNEGHEVARYDRCLAGVEAASQKTATSLGALNFGRAALLDRKRMP